MKVAPRVACAAKLVWIIRRFSQHRLKLIPVVFCNALIRYAFFKPEVLGTPGYAYGSYELPEDLSAPVVVALICNGHWGGRAVTEVERSRAEVEARAVCEAEASSGIGTYTGSCICAARISPGAARLWDYGIVVGYEWFEEPASGLFHVQFGTTTETLLFDEGYFQEVAVETYALRPSFHRAVADVMPGEMAAINHAAFKLGMAPVDEALSFPLYDALRSRVVEVPIKYVLDFIYYHEGKRRTPRHVSLGATLLDGASALRAGSSVAFPPVALLPPTRPTVAVDDQLSGSEEDSGGEPGVSAPTPDPAAAPGPPKRHRVQGESGESTSNLARLQAAAATLQSQCELFSFLPHPAVLRGLYAWAFGMRGLSVMHFARVTTQHQRELTRRFDMTDFLLTNRLQDPSRPGLRDDLLEALDGLFSVNHCCKMLVGELFQAARGFLCLLRSSTSPPDTVVLQEFVHWVDGRLEKFRALLARGDEETAATVKLDFCVSHPSYIQIIQDATQMHIVEMLRAAAQPQGEHCPLNGKSLCMKFLAVNTSRGRGDKCVFDYRGHFRPTALDPQVRAFIVQNYGGLKPEFKDLPPPQPPNVRAFATSGSRSTATASASCSAPVLTAPALAASPAEPSGALATAATPTKLHGTHSSPAPFGRDRRAAGFQPSAQSPGAFVSDYVGRLQVHVASTLALRRRLLAEHQLVIGSAVREWMVGILFGSHPPSMESIRRGSRYRLDHAKQATYSTFLRRTLMPLPKFVRLIRGETTADTRPNKALEYLVSESHPHTERWNDVVRQGVRPTWSRPFERQHIPPANHGSARQALNASIKNIRKGQDADRYLVLDLDLLSQLDGVTCSPFGAVAKGALPLSDDARVIHYLSFPPGASVNDHTASSSTIAISHVGAVAIARRIVEVETGFPGRGQMMVGDVSGAFRHITLHAEAVG
ncbi:hypothetical protein BBJ28_00008066 [Nothophytophthora sp. Chile5]|nr:hypothetical protein BBJ28_00008066 [Nothophytophthora sp. Chile5]